MKSDYHLSVLIPARNEEFLPNTIEDILRNRRGRTEVIVVLDGYWPNPGLKDHPDVKIIHHVESIGQRAATNEAAKVSRSRFIMKADAHCAFQKGFDVELMDSCEYNWTMVPRMYNLHAFDWKCGKCGERSYQGPVPEKCKKCDNTKKFEKAMVWKPRKNRMSDFMRFDTNMKFAYWGAYKKRKEAEGDIVPQLCAIGACWFMYRDRYWELGGLDEKHGSWGQMGVEIACKSWLSGGKQVVNKKAWFAHMFRTNKGFGFPYPISGKQVQKARKRSKDLWQKNKWPQAKHDLNWLLDQFSPVPEWHNDNVKKGIVYYTDNQAEERFFIANRKILNDTGLPIVSVSQYPIDFGENIVMDLSRSNISMFKQILTGLKTSTADIVFLCEHDILYDKSHFDFMPVDKNTFYYNQNRWAVDIHTGKAIFYKTRCPSHLVAYRKTLIKYYTKRLEMIEKDGFKSKIGYAPPMGMEKNGWRAKKYMSERPNVDIRHNNNLTPNRFNKEEFISRMAAVGWKEADEIPHWGKTKGRFEDFLRDVTKRTTN